MLLRSALLFSTVLALTAAPPPVRSYAPPASPLAVKQTRPDYRLPGPNDFWLAPVSAAERAQASVRPGLTLAGLHRAVPSDFLGQGEWTTLASGRELFRATLRSPGANGLRLHLDHSAPLAGQLWLSSPDQTNPAEPVEPGSTWTNLVEGEALLLEYEAPAGAGRLLPFQVLEASHLITALSNPRGAALTCNLDVTCYPEWAERARSVARYLFETNGGSALCSGTLVNTRNSSGIPYFLTADHCISTEQEARSLQAFWFYQSSVCNGVPRSLREVPTTSGATYLAGGSMELGDFTLLRLTGALPQGVTFSGWAPDEHPFDGNLTGIHHPTGDYKRISFGFRGQPVATRGRPEDKFYTVIWREGVTEGGSSGSPIFNSDGLIVGMLSGGPKPAAGQTECDLRPAYDFYGRFSTAYPALQAFLEERTAGTGTAPPPTPGVSTLLAHNVPVAITAGPVDGPSLLSTVYRVEVPAGATRLELRLRTPAEADFDLFARFGTAPELAGGRVTADFSATTDSGNETIVITPTSTPALRAGTYYVSLALFSTGVQAQATLTALITAPAAPTTPVVLTSGQTRTVTLEPAPAGSLLINGSAYQIVVPTGATRLEIRLETDTPNVDVDLFARVGQQSTVTNGAIVADFKSEGPAGAELITIANPRAGTYFIHLGIFTANVRISSRLTATISSGTTTPPPTTSGRTLTSGAPAAFTLAPVASPTLFTGENAYQIAVPAGATRLEVRVRTTTPGADVDLYVSAGAAPRSGAADFSSEGDTGDETLIITPASTPPLRAGVYYIALAVYTPNVRVDGTLLATVTTSGSSNTVAQPLIAGIPQRFTLSAVTGNSLILDPSFRLTVPEGSGRLRVAVSTTTPNVDIDLYARLNQAPAVVNSAIVADHKSEGPAGEESLDITPRAGTYYLSLGLFTANVQVEGSITVYVDAAATAPAASVELSSGTPARFTLPGTATPTLYNGANGFRIQVPVGATALTVRLNTTTPNADVDLYVRRETDIEVAGDDLYADFYSETATGNESITINRSSNPPLQPGTYFIALGNFARNVQVSGVVTATVERAPAAPSTSKILTFGQPVPWRNDAVTTPTLITGTNAFRLDVTNVSQMEIVLNTDTPEADVDLYVRYGTPPTLQNGNVVADFKSTGLTGNERVTITPGSGSPLRTGTYYVAMVVYSTGVITSGTLSAQDLSGALGDAPKAIKSINLERLKSKGIRLEERQ